MPRTASRPARADAPVASRVAEWLLWSAVLAAVTLAMLAARPALDRAHIALVYLLVVLGGSARSGRTVGLCLAVVAFFALNFFFLPPYHTLVVAAPLDWLVLVAFLATSAVAAQLLARAQSEAASARQRTAEVDRLSALGAETLNAARADDAVASIADVLRGTLGVARCEIFVRTAERTATLLAASGAVATSPRGTAAGRDGDDDASAEPEGTQGTPDAAQLLQWVAVSGRAALETADGTVRVGVVGAPGEPRGFGIDPEGARVLLLPLRVRDRVVGVLRLEHDVPLRLDPAALRFLEALAYYAALGVERVRLSAEAERAEVLERADEVKNAVLASVSHDLRTPLTTIKALAHAMGDEGDERALVIEEEADRLNRLVADLLDMSRLAGGALHVAPEINAVEDLVGAALQRVQGPQGARDIAVTLDASEPLLLGRFDFVHALHALVNLLENALKYSPADAPVELRALRAGHAIELTVSDRGPGVPEAERERIFEPFYRPAGSVPDAGGAGLGLSIARRLAEAQGGTVRLEPREDGGSSFVLRLPAADAWELEALAPPPPRVTLPHD